MFKLNPCDDFYEFACQRVLNLTSVLYKAKRLMKLANTYRQQKYIGYNIRKLYSN